MSNFITIAVSLIIAIFVSNFASQAIRNKYPGISNTFIIIFDIIIYVAIYLGVLHIAEQFDVNGNFEKQSKELSVNIISKSNNPIIGSELVLKSTDNIVWRIITQPANTNTVIYECKSVKNNGMISTTCNSKSNW